MYLVQLIFFDCMLHKAEACCKAPQVVHNEAYLPMVGYRPFDMLFDLISLMRAARWAQTI